MPIWLAHCEHIQFSKAQKLNGMDIYIWIKQFFTRSLEVQIEIIRVYLIFWWSPIKYLQYWTRGKGQNIYSTLIKHVWCFYSPNEKKIALETFSDKKRGFWLSRTGCLFQRFDIKGWIKTSFLLNWALVLRFLVLKEDRNGWEAENWQIRSRWDEK